MPPGRRSSRLSREPEEAPTNEYEKLRAQKIMRNNQLFQRLGLGQLKTLMTATRANNEEDGPQESGSLYDGEDTDGSDQEEVSKESQVSKDVRTNISNHGDQMSTKGTRVNKRIVAPEVHEQPIRVTRQRIAARNQEAAQSLTDARHTSSVAAENRESTQSLDAATQTTTLIRTEGDDNSGDQELVPRRKSMGKQLESLSRGLGIKIPIQIAEGNKRPEAPIQAAKFASEGGIALR